METPKRERRQVIKYVPENFKIKSKKQIKIEVKETPSVVTQEKYTKIKLPKVLRSLVWTTHIGRSFDAKCYCCKEATITPFDFECGHIVAERHGGSGCVSNLRPICRSCNASMKTRNMHEFIQACGFK